MRILPQLLLAPGEGGGVGVIDLESSVGCGQIGSNEVMVRKESVTDLTNFFFSPPFLFVGEEQRHK